MIAKEKRRIPKNFCIVLTFLFAVCLVSLVNTSHSSAKVYSEGNKIWGQLYEDYKTSGTGASSYTFKEYTYTLNNVTTTYVVPFKNGENCTYIGHYEGTLDGEPHTVKYYTQLVYPAVIKDIGDGIRRYKFIDCSDVHYGRTDIHPNCPSSWYDWKNIYYDIEGDNGYRSHSVCVPSFILDTDEQYANYYCYLATGQVVKGSNTELPEGFTIDDGGKVIDKNEIVICGTFAGGGGEFGSVYKEIQSYGDEKTCLYLLDEIPTQFGGDAYGLYTESEVSDYHREKMICKDGASPIMDSTKSIVNQYTMCMMGGSEYMRGYEYHDLFDASYDKDENDKTFESYYSIVPLQTGYIFTTSGVYLPVEDNTTLEMWRDLTCTLIDNALPNNPLLVWYFCNYINADSLDSTHLLQASLSQADLTINRPVFSNYGVAKQWYANWTVDSYNEIEYIPRGYYWHEDTHILDKNPPTNYNEEEDNDEKHTVPTPKPPKSDNDNEPDTEPTEEPSPSPNTPPVSEPITNTGGEIVINVTQSNDNTLTQDSHDKTNVYVTGGAVDSGGSNDSGTENGYDFINQLLKNPAGDSMIDVIGDALNDEDGDFFDILKHIFGFLPSPFLEFLSLGSVGAVIMRFLGR